MSFTQTPNYSLYKPTINADNDQWGTHLNANSDTLDTQLKAVSNAAAPSATNVGRNLIHNPMMNVAQRGTGPWTASGNYTLDRWSLNLTLDTASVTQAAIGDGGRTAIGDEAAKQSLQTVFTGNAGATAYTYLGQPIEDVRRLAGTTITVSFYAWASAALKLGVSFIQSFGTGGSPSATVYGPGQSVTLANAWAHYSVTLSVPSSAGKTLGTNNNNYTQLVLWLSSGANNNTLSGGVGVQSGTIALWGVQLEVGSVATPLEHIDPGLDLRNCQRFYQTGQVIFSSYASAGGLATYASANLPTTMRGVPAIAVANSASANLSGWAGGVYTPTSIYFSATSVATGATNFSVTYTASADL